MMDTGIVTYAAANHAETDAHDFRSVDQPAASCEERVIHPHVKVRLVSRKPFFGPGIVTLLRQIDSFGSVKKACEKNNMSYSKGWKLIHLAEGELNYQIVERQHGGKNGGAAFLTDRGKKLLEVFEAYEEQVAKAADEIYEKFFLDSELF